MDIFVLLNGERIGPLGAGELSKAVREGRITMSDLGWLPGYQNWVPLKQIPEVLAAVLPPVPNGALPSPSSEPLSAHVNRDPPKSLGAQPIKWRNWLAVGGLIFGISIGYGLLAASSAREKAKAMNCALSMKQIAHASYMWAMDNEDRFPFNVPVRLGGTEELCDPTPDGFDKRSYAHLAVMSNELSRTIVLVCPADSHKQAASDWQHIQPNSVTYLVHAGRNVGFRHREQVLVVCPIHGHVLRCDGSIEFGPRFSDLATDPRGRICAKPIPPPPPSAAQP